MNRSRTLVSTSLVILLAAGIAPAASPPANPLSLAQPQGGFMALSVDNAAASAQWYVDKLGFQVVKRIDPPGDKVHIVLLENAGAILELLEHPAARPRGAFQPATSDAYEVRGFFKSGFIVKQLDGLLRELRERKVEIKHGPFDIPEFKTRSFIIADPDGNLVQFFGP
jgi:catechol 2,3-dioxygenase-like lactoylglutathione lyase family enzyme